MRNKKLVFILVLILLIISISGCIEQNTSSNEIQDDENGDGTQDNGYELLYTVYPDTNDAPVLDLYWDDLDPEDVTRTTPYGCWEGWFEYDQGTAYEPANEMQFYTRTGVTPIHAVCSGTVVVVYTGDNNIGFLSTRYGRNYSVTYHHLEHIGLEAGDIVEAGDIIGYCEIRPDSVEPEYNESWWEIEVDVLRDNRVMTVPPYDYFSDESKEQLDDILNSTIFGWSIGGSPKTWTVTEGCSWIKYLSAPEWPASYDRFGIETEEIPIEVFFEANDLDWFEADEYGRVIGPTDECR